MLQIQALDTRLDQLAHRRRSLPEAAEAERIATERAELEGKLGTVEVRLTDLAREQRKAEADVEQVRTRKARDEQRLQAGQVGSPKELEGLQHEIETLNRRQSDLEDVELEVMERLEEATTELADLQARQTELDAKLAEADQARDKAFAEIDGQAEEIRTDRAGRAASQPEDLMKLYERLRTSHNGVGAAELRQRRCEGCRMELDATFLSQVVTAPPDRVQRCEECGRILVRTPQSGL
ncbi:zinc ribbon domain-containing protein [Flindersiella endophytica]